MFYFISSQHPAFLSKALANNHNDNFLNLALVCSKNYYRQGDWRQIFRTNIEEKRKSWLNFLEDKSCFKLKRSLTELSQWWAESSDLGKWV